MKDNFLIRLAVATIFIPLILVLTMIGEVPFLIFVEVLLMLGMLEFSRIVELKQAGISKFLFVFLGALFPVSAYFWRESGLLFLVTLSLGASGLALVIVGKAQRGLEKVSAFVFGTTYISCGLGSIVMIRQLPFWSGLNHRVGALWVIFVLLSVWSCDTFAYALGKLLGKHQLSGQISPKKTWEGAIGGFFGATLVVPFFHFLFFEQAAWVDMFVISIITGVLGQAGDLFESLLKRDVDVKDTSTIIPGHGGILDRFDSLLFVSPLVYFYLKFVVYG